MGWKIVIFSATTVCVLARSMAFACEPIGEPKPWYSTGLAQFVATAPEPRNGIADIRASLVAGRNGTETMLPGPVVMVPWSYGSDCKPLTWSPTRDGVWSPPDAPAFYTGRLRSRDGWISSIPTLDIEMARLQPVWPRDEKDGQRYGTTGGPLLAPLEFFDFYRVLPTNEEFDARQRQALARVEAWESMHQDMAGREPVRSMLRTLKMIWSR